MLSLVQLMQLTISSVYGVLIMPISFRGVTFNLLDVFEFSIFISCTCFFVEKILFFWRDKE